MKKFITFITEFITETVFIILLLYSYFKQEHSKPDRRSLRAADNLN